MKKFMMLSVASIATMVSLPVFAVDFTYCTRFGQAQQGASTTAGAQYGTPGTHFMLAAITVKCSANVQLDGTDGTNAAWYTLAGNSSKGNNTFGSSTGGFTSVTPCAVRGGCTNAEVTTEKTTANRGT